MISSKTLRKERRAKQIAHILDVTKIAVGVALGSALWLLMVWIIQVGVTSI